MLRNTFRTLTTKCGGIKFQGQGQQRSLFRIVSQYEKGVTFTLGKLTGVKEPGIRLCVPILQTMKKVDLRWEFQNLFTQDIITNDNVSVKVEAAVQFKVEDSQKAICNVDNYTHAVRELSAVRLREIISQFELNEILHNRKIVGEQVYKNTANTLGEWGITLGSVNIKDIHFDEALTRSMSKKAEAIRDQQAKLIAAETEVQTAQKFKEASDILNQNKTALELRRLETLLQMSREKGNTIVMIPSDLIQSLKPSN